MKKSLQFVIFMMITATPAILTVSLDDILKNINKKAVNYQKSVILKSIDNIKKQGSVPTKHCIKLINPNQSYLYFCSPEIIQSSYYGTPSATLYAPEAPTSLLSPDTVTQILSPIPCTSAQISALSRYAVTPMTNKDKRRYKKIAMTRRYPHQSYNNVSLSSSPWLPKNNNAKDSNPHFRNRHYRSTNNNS